MRSGHRVKSDFRLSPLCANSGLTPLAQGPESNGAWCRVAENASHTFNGGGDDSLSENLGNDNIHGGHNSDKLYGNGGNDALNGGPNSDTCNGGPGLDFLTSC
jgi:Ca2+-binding RTX toxin-like protein